MSSEIQKLADLASSDAGRRIETALGLAREFLGMDLGYATEFTQDQQVYRGVSGDGDGFRIAEGDGYPLDGTFCRRMVLGDIGNAVGDVRSDPQLRDLALTELGDIGAYVGVPLELSDGSLYGTLCAISHDSRPELGEREIALMKVLAAFVVSELERERLAAREPALLARIAELESGRDSGRGAARVEQLVPSSEFEELR